MPSSDAFALVDMVSHTTQPVVNGGCTGHEAETYKKQRAGVPARSEHPGCCDSSHQLIASIQAGLMTPSVPLSQAAAWRLQHAAASAARTYPLWENSNAINGSVADSCTRPHDEYLLRKSSGRQPQEAPAAATGKAQQPEGTNSASPRSCSTPLLLKSLPTELLYDDAGLQLFDQITYLPEYYLTSAEADILSTHGPNIVKEAVGDGTTIIELGVGSMRKTRILLDAVVAGGLQDVHFVALDLCEEPLQAALVQLQDHCQGRIKLAGLVGTYQQGLAHIQQQQQQQEQQGHSSSSSQEVTVISAAEALHSKQTKGAEDDLWTGLKGDERCSDDRLTASRNNHDGVAQVPAPHCKTDAEQAPPNTSNGSMSVIPPISGPDVNGSGAADQQQVPSTSRNTVANSKTPGKLIMWLGSSIGNYNRKKAAEFLRQVKELAMQPGDMLLVGIDRRNAPEKVAAAYSDAGGVTNRFIMNGLKHCQKVLNKQLQHQQCSAIENSVKPSSSTFDSDIPQLDVENSDKPVDSCNSIDLDAFKYFCLYNDSLGRHEAYYQAMQDTKIHLPRVGLPHGTVDGTDAVDAADAATHTVDIAAGELIHIEFSYKYSASEVQELAAAAGLHWVKAWTDSKQQFDLHLFDMTAS